MEEMGKTFSRIYQNELWSNGSGSGSLPENTSSYRNFLQNFLSEKEITSVLDLGCGDWQSSRLMNWVGVNYLGVDAVASVVKKNSSLHSQENIQFKQLDMVHDPLPAADLIIIKDVLQHWPNDTIREFAPRLRQYGHVLITNTLETYSTQTPEHEILQPSLNSDIVMGDMRPLDLSLEPFKWPVIELFRHTSTRNRINAKEIKTTVTLPG